MLNMETFNIVKTSASSAEDTEAKLDVLLKHVTDENVLIGYAKISLVFSYPGRAGDEKVDDVYDSAWRKAILRVTEMSSKCSLSALKEYLMTENLDGSHLLYVEESISKLESMKELHECSSY